jgi:hypothetical protein
MIPTKLAPLLALQLETMTKKSAPLILIDGNTNFESKETTKHQQGSAKLQESSQKRRKTVSNPDKDIDYNPNVNESFVSKYDKNKSSYHQHLQDMPKIHNTPICAKYHLMGNCNYGKSCSRAKSHTTLTKRQEADVESWLDKHAKKD